MDPSGDCIAFPSRMNALYPTTASMQSGATRSGLTVIDKDQLSYTDLLGSLAGVEPASAEHSTPANAVASERTYN